MISLIFRKILFKIKLKKSIFRRIVLSILILILSVYLPIVLIKTNFAGLQSEETLVGIASIVITALSAIFVVFQLQSSESVTCCDMLSNMNMSFIENERLLFLYQKLEECYRNPNKQLVIEDSDRTDVVHTSDLVAYFTFFEVLYEYIKHKVITVEQLDDLFGYRFFILVHNRCIQERELYAVPSSYVNIFELYSLWMEYRTINVTDKCSRLVIMQENRIPQYYLKNKLYLQERTYTEVLNREIKINKKNKEHVFYLKSLFPYHIKEILKLQESVVNELKEKDIFQPSTKEEILESMLVDGCYGVYSGEKLIAVSIIVFNRKTERNLAIDWEEKKNDSIYSQYFTFDSVQVHPRYRGFGLQKVFLDLAEELVGKTAASSIVATVSPKNPHSLKNFEKYKYYRHQTKNPYSKYGAKRILVRKDVKTGEEKSYAKE